MSDVAGRKSSESSDTSAAPDAAAESCGTVPGCDGHGGCGGHGGGGCGGHGATEPPILDARVIDPLIRQSAIFGVLVGLPPTGKVTIVTDLSLIHI